MKENTENSRAEYTHVFHTFEPVYDQNSQILILGSFPSVKSRENCFYYGHPQNRFWKVTAGVFGESVPETVEEKKRFLLNCRVAVWDVIASCDIIGSSDSSIKNVTANDMDVILSRADIRAIYANGEKAYRLFLKYCIKEGWPEIYKLPSTSPANAAWSVERLTQVWRDAFREGGMTL
ncbi:MAG: DNA-deoxyinosine glycosylase [Roseburia sp.]|nr:DNA-deoxyinosine glycosylase [Roseburia sp.]